jgi:hypothetical protein
VVGIIIDSRCVADGVTVRCSVISAMPELFSKDEGEEFRPGIVDATDLPTCEESLLPGGAEMRLLAGGSWEFPKVLHFCFF